MNISAVLKQRAERKAKRVEKGLALGLRKPKRRKIPARKRAFNQLKELCRTFVLLRAKNRTGGTCEIGMVCKGLGQVELAYHIFAAAAGNAIKYDERNLVGACAACNGGEYFARKRGVYQHYENRHRSLLGAALFDELKQLAGRKQISTAEALEMGEGFKRMIENGDYRK